MTETKTKLEDNLIEFEPMIALLEEDLGNSLMTANIDMQRLFLRGLSSAGDENELMLRLMTYAKKLVVARIQFVHQRNGFGTRLLDLLIAYGKEHHYEVIVFESVLSEPMKQFLIKNDFQLASEQEYEMNWILKI